VEKLFFYLWDLQKGTSSLHREIEKGLLCKIAWGEENLSITTTFDGGNSTIFLVST
jgi:hypothetical protein